MLSERLDYASCRGATTMCTDSETEARAERAEGEGGAAEAVGTSADLACTLMVVAARWFDLAVTAAAAVDAAAAAAAGAGGGASPRFASFSCLFTIAAATIPAAIAFWFRCKQRSICLHDTITKMIKPTMMHTHTIRMIMPASQKWELSVKVGERSRRGSVPRRGDDHTGRQQIQRRHRARRRKSSAGSYCCRGSKSGPRCNSQRRDTEGSLERTVCTRDPTLCDWVDFAQRSNSASSRNRQCVGRNHPLHNRPQREWMRTAGARRGGKRRQRQGRAERCAASR